MHKKTTSHNSHLDDLRKLSGGNVSISSSSSAQVSLHLFSTANVLGLIVHDMFRAWIHNTALIFQISANERYATL
jgi:hypothetical protein